MNAKIIAAIAVVIIVIAGVGVYLATDDGDDDKDYNMTLTDSNGVTKTYEFSEELSRVVMVSSNELEWAQILGLTGYVVGACTTGLAENSLDDALFKDVVDVGKYNGTTSLIEKIVSCKAQIVITPTSMGITAENQATLLKDYNIPTITLECYGETMLTDAQTLVDMLGNSKTQAKLDDFKDTYNSVMKTVQKASSEATKTKAVACIYKSGFNYYTTDSELGKILVDLNTENILGAQGFDVSGTFVKNPSSEKVTVMMDDLDYVFVRIITASGDVQATYTKYMDADGQTDSYENTKVALAKHVIAVETDVMSGCRDYIGQVMLCQLLGYDVGDLNALTLVNQFNEKYGFNGTYEHLAWNGYEYLV